MDYQFLEGETDEAYNVEGVWIASSEALAQGEARVVFDYADAEDYYYVKLTQERARIGRVQGGAETELGVSEPLHRFEPPEQLRFTLQRRPWKIVFFCNDVLAAEAEDRAFPPGRVGFGATGEGITLEDSWVQVVEEPYFTDDFMRTEEAGAWEEIDGKWRNNAQGRDVERSANAFSYRAEARETALAVAGHPFWSDYLYEAAVRCDAPGAVGLVFHYRDAQNYLLFRWSSAQHEDGGVKQLVRVFRGTRTELARLPGGFAPEVWYKLRVAGTTGRVFAWIDDTPLLDVNELTFGQGRIGLYAEQTMAARRSQDRGALFDDVLVKAWPLFTEDFDRERPGRWRPTGGTWQVETGEGWCETTSADRAFFLTGPGTWTNYTYTARVRAERGAVGLAFHVQDERNGYLFRWTGPGGAGTQQLVKMADGGETVLAEQPGGYEPGTWQHVTVQTDGGYLSARANGAPVLDAVDFQWPRGGLGFFAAEAAGARFDDVFVSFYPVSEPPVPTIPPIFQNDPYMTAWANPQGAWVPGPDGSQWHKGYFFGDQALEFRLPGVGAVTGGVTLVLGAEREDMESGYALALGLTAKSRTVQLTLRRRGAVLAEQNYDLPGDATAAQVRFERRGRFLLVWIAGQPALTARTDG